MQTQTNLNQLTTEQIERIKRSWVKLSANQGLKYGRTSYAKAEAYYFAGVVNTLTTMGYDMRNWTFLLLVGRSPIKDKAEYQALLEQA